MSKKCAAFMVIAVVLAFSPDAVMGQAFRNAPQDARAMGMGNAFTARADNASAIYYNPAGIAFLDTPLAVTGNFTIIEPDYKNKSQDFRTNDKEFYIPNAFVASNLFNDYLSFGYGAFSEFGLETSYSKSSPAAPLAYFGSLKTVDNRFVWALKPPEPFDWIAVGGGFDLLFGKTRTKALTDFGPLTVGMPTGEIGRARYTADGHTWGWNIGALIKAKRMHSFGISFASQMDLDMDGRFKISPVPASVAPVPEISLHAKSEFVLPARINAGYLFEPVDWFRCEFDVTWLKFDSFNNVTVQIDDPTGTIPNQVIDFDYTNSWVWSLGAELGPFKGVSVRGGWAFIETPVPARTFNTLIPDANRNVASVGLGYKYRSFSIDLAYAAVIFNSRKINNTVGQPFTSVNGTWKGFTNQVMMGLSYEI